MSRPKIKKLPTPTEPFERCDIVIEKRPGQLWTDAHQAEIDAGALDRGELVPADDDMFVGVNLYGFYVIPQRNVPPNLWPQGRTLLLTLQEISFVDFKEQCMADIDRQRGPDDAEAHRAELADIGAQALAAARALRDGSGNRAPGADVHGTDSLVATRPPWWRRIFGGG